MDSKNNTNKNCQGSIVYLKGSFSIIGLVIIGTIFWIIGCEILWYGILWIEDIHKSKGDFYIYKIISLIIFVGFGLILILISTSLVLFGIPFTAVHIDHLFNRKSIQLSKNSTINNDELQKNSKQALKWTISILILIIIGLIIGAAGCEVIEWSGLKFKGLFNDKNEINNINIYLKQFLFLTIMFSGLLLFFFGFLLAPFMLAFAGVVSFNKKNNSYRLRPRHHRRRHQNHIISQV